MLERISSRTTLRRQKETLTLLNNFIQEQIIKKLTAVFATVESYPALSIFQKRLLSVDSSPLMPEKDTKKV